jgi:hypothetical protein
MMMARNSSVVLKEANANIARLAVEAGADLNDLQIDDRKLALFQAQMYFHGYGTAKNYQLALRKFLVCPVLLLHLIY